MRSARAVSALRERGFHRAYSVTGGIARWREEVDESLGRTDQIARRYIVGVLSGNDAVVARRFSTRLRAWFKRHGRALPWRNTRDPYRILVSELMLQQTQVARVVHFYEVSSIASRRAHARCFAPADVREAWDGLGYYARARNLHTLARTVTRDDRGGALRRSLTSCSSCRCWALYRRRSRDVRARAAQRPGRYEVARVLTRAFAPHLQPKRARDLTRLRELAHAILPRTGKQRGRITRG